MPISFFLFVINSFLYYIIIMRTIAIGDIHAEYEKLTSLLDKISPQKDDTLVFLGDYIDRGSKARQVVDKIIDMKNYCNCVYLMGSHEYALLHSKSDDYYNYLFWNYGGDKTVESYGGYENIFKVHGEFFKSLKYYYLTDKYLFIHAGIRPGIPLEHQNPVDMVYIRSEFFDNKHDLKQKIIFGHTEFEQPRIWQDKICIDTGCGKFKDSPLTAIVIENGTESFVNSN